MARVLVQVPSELNLSKTKEEICPQLHHLLRKDIQDHLSVSDAYVTDYYAGQVDNYVIGACETEDLLAEVRHWNHRILNGFLNALSSFERKLAEGLRLSQAIADKDKTSVIPLDCQETYQLRLYASAIDNHFLSSFYFMNFLPNSFGFPYARILISKEELSHIEEKPASYAILEVNIR